MSDDDAALSGWRLFQSHNPEWKFLGDHYEIAEEDPLLAEAVAEWSATVKRAAADHVAGKRDEQPSGDQAQPRGLLGFAKTKE